MTTDTPISLNSSYYHQPQQWQSIFTYYTQTSPLILYVIKSRLIYRASAKISLARYDESSQ